MNIGAVVETDVPVAAALRGEVHKVPDGSEQVDAALLEVWGHARVRSVEVAQCPIRIASEDGHGGVLTAFAVSATEVVLERAVARAKEAQPGGAHRARLGLPLSVHQVIDDARAIRLGQKLAEADRADRRVARLEVARTLFSPSPE